MDTFNTSKRTLWISFTCLTAIYAVLWMALPDGFWINDNGCKFIQMKGLIETHYRQLAIPWPGRDLDPAFAYNPLPLPFGRILHGRLYGYYSDTFALVTSVAYEAFGFKGITLIPLLSGLLLLGAIWRITDLLPGRRHAKPLSLLVAGLCTPVLFYSMTYWEHITASACIVWSIFFRLRYDSERPRSNTVISAFLCGLAIYFRDELLVLALALAIVPLAYSVRRWKTHALFVCMMAITLVPLWATNLSAYENILGKHLGTSAFSSGAAAYLVDRWHVFRVLLINSHASLLISIMVSMPYLLLLVLGPLVRRLPRERMILILATTASTCGAVILWGHLHSSKPVWWLLSSNAMFATSPGLIFAFLHQCPRQDTHERHLFEKQLWSIMIVFILAYIMITPGGSVAGIHWGCRFWLPLYAILSALAASQLAQWWESGSKQKVTLCLIVSAMALSLGTQAYSMKLLHHRNAFSVKLNECVAGNQENVVITIGWHLPQDLAMNFYSKRIFSAKSEADIDGLRQLMIQKGIPAVQLVSAQPLQMKDPVIVEDGLNFSRIEIYSLKLF